MRVIGMEAGFILRKLAFETAIDWRKNQSINVERGTFLLVIIMISQQFS